MEIRRAPSPYPRRGPSCLLILLIIGGVVGLSFLFSNREQVIEAIVPTPTPEPTRDAPSYALSASLYERDGEYDKAIENYQNAIRLDPEGPEYYVRLINLLTTEGEAEEALLWAERVAIIAPDDDSVLAAVAAAYLINGDRLAEIGVRDEADIQYQRAVDTARRATQINPNNADAYAYMAGALISLDRDNFPAAQELVDTAIAIDSQNAVVHFYRALVFETQGYYEQAIEEYETALSLNPNFNDSALSLAYSYFYTDNRQRAIVTLRDLLEKDPDNADASDALGWMYFLAGQYPEAETYLEDAVELDPDMIRAHAHLGATYFRQFNYERAIPELEIAVNSYDRPSNTNSLFYNMLGFAYLRTDSSRCDEASALFRQVLEEVSVETFNGQNAEQGLADCRQATLGTDG